MAGFDSAMDSGVCGRRPNPPPGPPRPPRPPAVRAVPPLGAVELPALGADAAPAVLAAGYGIGRPAGIVASARSAPAFGAAGPVTSSTSSLRPWFAPCASRGSGAPPGAEPPMEITVGTWLLST